MVVKDRTGVTVFKQVKRCSQACRSRSDDGDTLSCWCLAPRQVGGRLGQIHVSDAAFQQADGYGCVVRAATAAFLAGSRTNPPQGCRQCDILLDRPDGLRQLAGGDLPNHQRNIHMGRTQQLAGSHAVAEMVAEQQFQRCATGLMNNFRVTFDDHAVFDQRGA